MVAVALAASACTGKFGRSSVQNEEAPASAVSFIKMNDAGASAQLLSGFYATEAGAWRWTSGKFAALLAVPPAAAQNGGTLTLAFTIPDVVIKHSGKIALSASVNGKALGSNTYDAVGPAVFTADVPKELLTTDSIKVEFALDKDLPPNSAGDARELGVVANSVGLAGK
jgi:hypothetical protein